MQKKITQNIIQQIESGNLKMRPKYLFIIGSIFSIIGLFLSLTLALFLGNIIYFRYTHPGFGAERKVIYLLTSLPWYLPLLVIASIIVGYLLLKRYDFSYSKYRYHIFFLIIFGIVAGNYLLNHIGLNQFLQTKAYFRNLYQNENSIITPSPNHGYGKGSMLK